MNLEALRDILDNNPDILEHAANDGQTDFSTIRGIASFAISHGYPALSSKQKYNFDKIILPLIHNVQCSGYTHEFDEVHNDCSNILDDRKLIDYYRDGYAYCETCEAQSDADAHSKAVIMRD